MKNIHVKQSKLLELLKANIDSPLTLKTLGELAGIDSPGVLYHHIGQLEKKGYLKRNADNPKDYIILDSPEKPVVYINKYGMAQCGPEGSILSGNPIDRIPVASSLLRFSAAEAFIVEARGDSMNPKIKNRDIIIAKKQSSAEHGDLIVCVFKLKALIKKFSNIKGNVSLVSENQDEFYPMIVTENDDFKIEGVIKNIINYS